MRLDPVRPWAGTVTSTVLLGGLAGLIAIVLAFRSSKSARFAHVIWSLIVAYVLSSAFWGATYRFDGMEDFKRSAWVLGGYLLVLLGSILHVKNAPPKRPGYRRS